MSLHAAALRNFHRNDLLHKKFEWIISGERTRYILFSRGIHYALRIVTRNFLRKSAMVIYNRYIYVDYFDEPGDLE